MKYVFIFSLILGIAVSAFSQDAEVIKIKDLEEIIKEEKKEIKVINFWATWCRPCVKELPYFEDLERSISGVDLNVILVSMDFAEDFEKKVVPFLKKRNIKSTVKLLDELDYNTVIDQIDPRWSGSIPATLLIDSRNGKRLFIEKEFKEGELQKVISNFINNS